MTFPQSNFLRSNFLRSRRGVATVAALLLMLFLFSDVGEFDAPTRIKVGSHRDIARSLEPAGEAGMSHAMLDELIAAFAAIGAYVVCLDFSLASAGPVAGLLVAPLGYSAIYLLGGGCAALAAMLTIGLLPQAAPATAPGAAE